MSIKTLNEILESPAADLGTDILDSLMTVPFGCIVVDTYRVGVGIENYFFFRKFARFLGPMRGMEKEVNVYLEKLSALKREKLGEYMLSLLSKAESPDKTWIMGLIFKSAVQNEIDNEMMLRLVSIVTRSFVSDLKELPKYIEESDDFSIATNEFINLGLIDNDTGGVWKNGSAVELNEIGRTLCRILNNEGWFDTVSLD